MHLCSDRLTILETRDFAILEAMLACSIKQAQSLTYLYFAQEPSSPKYPCQTLVTQPSANTQAYEAHVHQRWK